MIPGLYSAASALTAAELNHETIAENLANANMPGYRRGGLIFETVQQNLSPHSGMEDHGGGTRVAGSYTNFEPGPLQKTDNTYDFALSSNVYFVLDGPNGPLYTRNGVFERTAQGELQSNSGLRLRGAGQIPADAARVTVSKDGVVKADSNEVGRLQLAEFRDPSVLRRAGSTLFEGPAAQPPAPGSFTVEQGYREGSNVQVVNEMVGMLTGMRHYEAAEKALKALEDAVSLNTKPS